MAGGQEAQEREGRASPLVRPERVCCPVPLDPTQSPTTFTTAPALTLTFGPFRRMGQVKGISL